MLSTFIRRRIGLLLLGWLLWRLGCLSFGPL